MKIFASVALFALIASCVPVDLSESAKVGERYKILALFSHPGKSHFDVFGPLLKELARRGHELTVVSYFPWKNATANYKDIDLRDSQGIYVNVVDLKLIASRSFPVALEVMMLWEMAKISCEKSLAKPEVLDLIGSDQKFDLILTEVFNSDCFLGFVHKFKAPFIGFSSHGLIPWSNSRASNPDNPSFIPNLFSNFSPEMTFIQRVTNTVALALEKMAYRLFITPSIQRMVNSVFGPETPPLLDIANNVSAILVNTHFSLHGSRPLMPNVIDVGGMHILNEKPLPKHIKEFLDDAPQGVLYFSWGSMIKATSIHEEKLNEIVKVLGSLPQKVVWKWEDEDLPRKPANVMVQKWLPQLDILRHPNVKGYLAHGGLLGLTEAIYAGVPLVIVPFFGDQHSNAAAAVSRGMAVSLTYDAINEETLGSALRKIFNDPSYMENAQAVSRAYKDRPIPPLESAVWWTEYFARNKGQPLMKSAAAELTWVQYHLLDVYAFLFVSSVVSLLLIIYVSKLLFGKLCGKRGSEKSSRSGTSKNGVEKKKRA